MENEQQAPPPSSSAATTTTASRQTAPQISVYSGMPDRQTVQVIQQALHRQPSTAAQYLQQMYAAQQQHLMLQTAALQQQQQQQHLSSAQLQSLAAVQQASLAASRQGGSPNSNASPQTSQSSAAQINLSTSPAAAQLMSRAQNVNSSSASGITQQAVLLGNATSPALTASQAQMYLRAQMLIFTPTAAVTTMQSDVSTAPTCQSSSTTTAQVQNLAIRCQPTACVNSSQSQLPSLAMKPAQPGPNSAQGKMAGHSPTLGAKGGQADGPDNLKKGDPQHHPNNNSLNSIESRGNTPSRTPVPVTTHSLIAPAYSNLQSHHLLQQQKQIQHQFVIQQQIQPRPATQLLQTSAPSQQPSQAQSLVMPSVTLATSIQSHHAPLSSTATLQHPPPQFHLCSAQKQGTIQQVPPSPHLATGLQPMVLAAQQGHETGTLNGHPACLNHHGTQRKLPQASAVILQIQPAPAAPQSHPQESTRKDPTMGEKDLTENLSAQSLTLHPQSSTVPASLPPAESELTGSIRPSMHEVAREAVHAHNNLSSTGMTSGNGNSTSTVAGTTPQNGENKPPQAIVKPQILTHVIEGFVIQEGAEPFPTHRTSKSAVGSEKRHKKGGDSLVDGVGRSSLPVENLKKKYQQALLVEKSPQQDTTATTTTTTTTTDSEMEEPSPQESKDDADTPKLKCELCGRVDFEYKFKRSKRFCSMACAKRYNVGCTKRVGLFHPDRSKLQKTAGTKHDRRRSRKGSLQNINKDTKKQPPPILPSMNSVAAAMKLNHSREDSSRGSDNSSYEEPLSPISASSSASHHRQEEHCLELPDIHMRDLVEMGHNFLPSDPIKWNVEDVYEFIRSLPGCQEISEEFRAQEIDGQALLLLKEDHLMSAMNIKLGPALKIYARISSLKDS
ncbi:polyhomeotic-like protein 2 isoform X3 [Pleurodeles waltl]|uniref:polyhomeotic-like protein 2 isoform X3 n=1 Tax=Pleurodeles waltl TaxID=8319 RepID=UPI0037093D8D